MNADERDVVLFVRGLPRSVRIFRITFAVLVANFAIPVFGYLVDRRMAEDIVSRLDVSLGGPPIVETGALWHMLAIGNVATLAVLCAALWLDLRRAYSVLPALVFLKATSALVSLGLALGHGLPAFAAVFLLDGITCIVMVVSATSAYRALVEPYQAPLPWWSYLLIWPRRVQRSLDLVAQSGRLGRIPTLLQVALGIARMLRRLITRPNSVGRSCARVRSTRRARVLAFRPLRLFVLLWERAVAPFDLSGLASPPERIVRHVLAAHHEGAQLLYDLELLSLYDGWLERLRDAAREVAAERTPRARFLADLCVFEGYHAEVYRAACLHLAGGCIGTPQEGADPDLSLFAHLAWCASRPMPSATSRRRSEGEPT